MSEIMENQQRFDAKAKRIREDGDLSREAKRRLLGEAFAVARDTHERLVREHREQSEKKIADARKTVMGIKYPKMMLESDREIGRMSYRDAFDRAERAATKLRKEPTAMTDLLERAEMSGDPLLANAVFHVAARRGLHDVAESYLRSRPSEAESWRKLADAKAESGGGRLYGWIPPRKPAELNGAAAPGERFDEVGQDRTAPTSARSEVARGFDNAARPA